MRRVAALILSACVPALPAAAADAFPDKPVRLIVPLAPGGGSDIVARLVAQGLTERWGQSVVVDNRPGAGSTVGTSIAAKARPDGYTVMVTSSSVAISPALHRKLSFDVKRDLTGVSLIASQPSILAVHPSVEAKGVRDLIGLAKASPGKLAYASAGPGSATHLGSELFRMAAGVELVHVPYKSAGLAANALLTGETQILLTNMATALPLAKSGKVRALGVTSPERAPQAPELPTLAESGLPGFEYATWYGMLAPSATPAARIQRIAADLTGWLGSAEQRKRFGERGLVIHATSPTEFSRYLATEIAKWDDVVRKAKIRID